MHSIQKREDLIPNKLFTWYVAVNDVQTALRHTLQYPPFVCWIYIQVKANLISQECHVFEPS